MQESQDVVRELPPKRPRYHDIPRFEASTFTLGGSTGSSATSALRNIIDSGPIGGGFPQGPPHVSFPDSNLIESIWCP